MEKKLFEEKPWRLCIAVGLCARMTPQQLKEKEKQEASATLPVHCDYSSLQAVEDLIPNPRNPNTHSPEQIAALSKVMNAQGWRAPIVVSNQSGFIVAGHGRLEAAKMMGLVEVPVDRQDFKDEAHEWAHMIADNRIAALAEMDNGALTDLLGELKAETDMAFDATGFSEGQFDALMDALKPMTYNKEGVTDYGEDLTDGKFESEYSSTTIRQIVLVYDVADYESICADLDKIKDDQNLETNTDAVTYAVRKAGAI